MQPADPCPGCWLKELDSESPFITRARFDLLARTNVPPEPEELHVLHQFVAKDADRLSALKRICEQLDVLTQKVKDEIDDVQRRKDSYSLVSSPVRRVEEDIWRVIFSMAADYRDLQSSYKISSLDVKLSPWNLSYVCSGWRTIALSMSALWSSFRLTSSDILRYHSIFTSDRPSVILPMLLGLQHMRSAGRTLSVSLGLTKEHEYKVGKFVNSALLWVIVLRDFSVEELLLSCSSLLARLLAAFPHFSLSSIKRLTILGLNERAPVLGSPFRYSAKLEKVTSDPATILFLDLPLSSIKAFTSSPESEALFCARMLSRSNNIEEAKLYLQPFQRALPLSIQVQMGQLRHLELSERPEIPESSLLFWMELPALQYLSVTGITHPESLQVALGPRLQTIVVKSNTSNVTELLPRLLSAPQIQSITLRCPWSRTLPTMEHFIVGPTLKTLKLYGIPSNLQESVFRYFKLLHPNLGFDMD